MNKIFLQKEKKKTWTLVARLKKKMRLELNWCLEIILMRKVNISMNVDDTTLGEYPKHSRVLICCIHDCICH